jgi:hypothetical protein
VRFIVGDEWQDPGAKLVYRERDHAFDVEGERPKGVASLLVNDLQLEITHEGVVLYPWGLCPRSTWGTTEAMPPTSVKGTLIAQVGQEIVPGVSRRISGNRWPVHQSQGTRWVCVGDPKAKGDQGKGIEFAPGCVAVLEAHSLVALWLHSSPA